MGYNNGKLMMPINVADMQRALGSTQSDLGALCRHDNINPMAKYKPVRYNTVDKLTPSQRSSVRYGMSWDIPRFNTGNANPDAKWVYEKPRGLSSNEPFRQTDFAKELDSKVDVYDEFACAPFAFDVQGAVIDSDSVEGNGGAGFPLYVNNSVNIYYANHDINRKWSPNTCMNLSEVLGGYNGNGYIGFSIHDLDDPTKHAAIVTNKKIREVSDSVPVVFIVSVSRWINNIWYPGVTMFSNADLTGHTFRFIAFLYDQFPNGNPVTDAYVLLPDNTDVYSLEFDEGMDRHDVVVSLFNTISGLECSLKKSGVSLTYVDSTTYDGNTYYRYLCTGTVSGTITTPSRWANDSVRVKTVIRTDMGYPNSISSPSNYEDDERISLTYPSYTYDPVTLSSGISFYVYFLSQVPVSSRSVSVSAVAYGEAQIESERITFDNSFDVKAAS